jgi:hypothetical protein
MVLSSRHAPTFSQRRGSEAMIGQTIDRYRVVDSLGAGGMGVVYRAEDLALHRPVALKFLPGEFAADDEVRARFLREARVAAALNHPNTCTVYEVGEVEARPFIAMELIDGRWRSRINFVAGGRGTVHRELTAVGNPPVVSDFEVEVSLDGEPPQRTPMHLSGVAAGLHELRAFREGYVTQRIEIIVEDAKTVEVRLKMENPR